MRVEIKVRVYDDDGELLHSDMSQVVGHSRVLQRTNWDAVAGECVRQVLLRGEPRRFNRAVDRAVHSARAKLEEETE